MKAWVLKNFGYENLFFEETDKPTAGDEEVVIKVKACGVCYRDIIDIEGGFKYTVLPTTPGHEICGEVVEVGKGAPFSKGDIVISRHGPFCGRCSECTRGLDNLCLRGGRFVHTMPGGYAEYVKAHWSAFIKVPQDISQKLTPSQLSILFCAVGTAFRAVVSKGRVRAGCKVLVTGASGGVGIHAVQIAKSAGATVIAVTSSPEKVEKIREAGADHVIDFENGQFNRKVMQITDGVGVDVVIETTGSIALEGAVRSLRVGGVLVEVGNIKVDRYPLNPGYFILRELKFEGTVGITASEIELMFELIRRDKIKPVVWREFPLEDAKKSHEILKTKSAVGRIVLIP